MTEDGNHWTRQCITDLRDTLPPSKVEVYYPLYDNTLIFLREEPATFYIGRNKHNKAIIVSAGDKNEQ